MPLRKPVEYQGNNARRACKPDSVPRGCPRFDDHSSGRTVTRRLKLPTRTSGPRRPAAVSLARPAPREVPIRHCSRWGLPCRSGCPSRGALLPHRFTLAAASRGGLFSVALSLGLPPPGVTRHRCLVESGLSSDLAARGHPALRARKRLARAAPPRQGQAKITSSGCNHGAAARPIDRAVSWRDKALDGSVQFATGQRYR